MPFSRSKTALISLTIFTALGAAALYTGILSVPQFGIEDRGEWKEVSDEKITVRSTAWINNENPVELNFSRLELKYGLKMNSVKMAEGSKNGIKLEEGNHTLGVETDLYQERIPKWWVSHVRKDERTDARIGIAIRRNTLGLPLRINGISYGTTIETDIEETMSKTVDRLKGNYSSPEIAGIENSKTNIEVKGGSASFGKVTRDTTVLDSKIKIKNPNSYPIPTPRLAGKIEMNEINLAEIDSEPVSSLEKAKIDPEETRTINFEAEIDNQKVDDWLKAHIRDDERSNGSIDLYLVFDLAGSEYKMPTTECGFRVQTGIFVDGQESNSSFKSCSNAEPLTGKDNNNDKSIESGSNKILEPLIDSENSNKSSLNPIPGISTLKKL